MKPGDEPFDNRSRNQFERAYPRQDFRRQKARAALLRARLNHQRRVESQSPDLGSGTVSINRLMTSSGFTFSDSAWKLRSIRCLKTG